MKQHLQISFEIDLDKNPNNGAEVNLTPIDLPVSDDLANGLKLAIGLGDVNDAKPGDGMLEQKVPLRVPVKINLFIAKLDTTINLDATAVMKVVEK